MIVAMIINKYKHTSMNNIVDLLTYLVLLYQGLPIGKLLQYHV